MGWGAGNLGVGSGGGLNFKVVCNPQPAYPKENTIWVDTDVDITSWIFSATEPSPAEAGMVWIAVGTSSTVEFNALKKNGIQVYPISAKQYIGGAWVDKTAKSYQGGEWVEWVTYLYKSGDECTDITGGFTVVSGFTKKADSLYCAATLSNEGFVHTTKKIDLSQIRSIYIRATISENKWGVFLSAANSPDKADRVAHIVIEETGDITKMLDVSGLGNEVYVTLYATDGATITVHEIWAV